MIICDFTISNSQKTLVPFLCLSHVVCSSLAKIGIKATSPKPLLLFLLTPCLLSPFIYPISTSRCLIEPMRRGFRRDGRVFERTGFVCTLHFKRVLCSWKQSHDNAVFHSENRLLRNFNQQNELLSSKPLKTNRLYVIIVVWRHRGVVALLNNNVHNIFF